MKHNSIRARIEKLLSAIREYIRINFNEAIDVMYSYMNSKDTRNPASCFCGGKASVCAYTYKSGDLTVYYDTCSRCLGRLMLIEASIAYRSENEAIAAWDTAMAGERING